MNDLVEKLLQPVPGDNPCGPDLSYDPRLEELETILKGKPEIDIGSVKKPAEPPDWGQLRYKCAEFLTRSKHLRACVMFACSLLKTGGTSGFADGLHLTRGLLEKYWAGLYPLLDADDNNDPTQRLNILGAITASRGTVDGWLTILDYLYSAPAFRPRAGGPIAYEDLLAARRRETTTEGAPENAPDPGRLREAIRTLGPDPVTSQLQALRSSLESLQAIDQFLTSTLGVGNTISFETLENALKELIGVVEAYLPIEVSDQTASLEGGSGASEAHAAAGSGGISVSGTIRSRDDVVQALDSICEYYRQIEPCSPVPYLLRRAQKLAKMDFVQAVQELSIATVDTLRPSMGSGIDSPSPEAPAT
jgi:type VI secretion system protein ImpA